MSNPLFSSAASDGIKGHSQRRELAIDRIASFGWTGSFSMVWVLFQVIQEAGVSRPSPNFPRSPFRTACVMLWSPSNKRRATQLRLGTPGKRSASLVANCATACLIFEERVRPRCGRQTYFPLATSSSCPLYTTDAAAEQRGVTTGADRLINKKDL